MGAEVLRLFTIRPTDNAARELHETNPYTNQEPVLTQRRTWGD
jgi:hypothetical protein